MDGVSFFCYKGITVFDVMQDNPKKLISLDGQKFSIVDALTKESGKYRKVYLSLGVNELGYYDDQGFHDSLPPSSTMSGRPSPTRSSISRLWSR